MFDVQQKVNILIYSFSIQKHVSCLISRFDESDIPKLFFFELIKIVESRIYLYILVVAKTL